MKVPNGCKWARVLVLARAQEWVPSGYRRARELVWELDQVLVTNRQLGGRKPHGDCTRARVQEWVLALELGGRKVRDDCRRARAQELVLAQV